MMHFMLTEFARVNMPQYYDYDVCSMTILGMICHVIKVVHVVGPTLRICHGIGVYMVNPSMVSCFKPWF